MSFRATAFILLVLLASLPFDTPGIAKHTAAIESGGNETAQQGVAAKAVSHDPRHNPPTTATAAEANLDVGGTPDAQLLDAVRDTTEAPADPAVEPSAVPARPFGPVTSPDLGEHCAENLDPDGLTDFFSQPVGTLEGADYQRTFALPDGRVLWTFQDGFVSGTLVHNVAMVQSGRCFTMLNHGARSWLLGDDTEHMRRWHWILDGDLSSDETQFHLFIVEMTAQTNNYIDGQVDATALRRVVLDAQTLEVQAVIPELIDGRDLYGWSVTSDQRWTYLYSHCYLQFGHSEFGAHPCTSDAKIARVPKGRFDADRQYWDGTNWRTDPSTAINIVNELFIVPTGYGPLPSTNNPISVRFTGDQFVLISNPGDWWGETVFVASARQPWGPWTIEEERQLSVDKCEDTLPRGCSSYHASWIPWLDPTGRHIWAIGHNTWGIHTATALWAYRPTFHHTQLRSES